MKLGVLCQKTEIICPAEVAEVEISTIATDSRQAMPGGLFICIPGLHTDGHTYIAQAVRNGAIAVLIRQGADVMLPEGIICLSAEDPRRACAYLFNSFYGDPCSRMKFIGVTGTNGKTTVTHMLRAILEASMYRCGLIGTVGCESAGGRHLENRMYDRLANMTTPDPPELYRMLAEMADDGVEYVLMEVTSHALALSKPAPIQFEAAVFTNLTPEHLDFHGDMESYADAKAKLFRRSRLSVINADSPYAEQMRKSSAGKVVTCGIDCDHADYVADDIRYIGNSGVDYQLRSGRSRLRIQCPVPGGFSVINSMQAAVCALELGIGAAAVKTSLASMAGIRGRMERVRLGVGADFSVIIDYAHTPDALEKLLRTARDSCTAGQRIVLVFGCGGDRDKSKRPVMGAVASRYADLAIVTSDNSRSEEPESIIREILTHMNHEHTVVIPERAEAIRYAVLHSRPGDLILLAGKGHEEYEINRSGRHHFNEREFVRRAFEEKTERDDRNNDSCDPQANG